VGAYIRKDAPYRAAKRAGLRSRAAPKLQELDERYKLMRTGMRVLDLGCWPGGWLQIASRAVGPSGRVVGVDLEPVAELSLDNVSVFVGDVLESSTREILADALGGHADVVLCDLAPKLSGIKVADRERHLRLLELAVDLAAEFLVDEGALVIKLFSGVESEATALLKKRIGRVVKSRPDSTRKGSSEIYAIATKRAGSSD
jgi:23S rRNA (uridine2552-2'-O)-methyltransferase